MGNLLSIQNLSIDLKTHKVLVHTVRGINLELGEQETLAIVGESGCGKSMSMKGVMGLLPQTAGITEGSIRLAGRELRDCSEGEMQKIRGGEIAMIFQDPMTSLNPTMTIGDQIEEMLRKHRKEMGKRERRERYHCYCPGL